MSGDLQIIEQCNGRCCAVFTLPYAAAELREKSADITDGGMIADMVVPLTTADVLGRSEQFALSPPHGLFKNNWFTCRHWNEETRLCEAYDRRPGMCRKYPYGKQCVHCGAAGSE